VLYCFVYLERCVREDSCNLELVYQLFCKLVSRVEDIRSCFAKLNSKESVLVVCFIAKWNAVG